MILKGWIHVIIHLSKPIECTTPRVNPNINCRLWVIRMCHVRFTSYKGTTLAGDVNNRGSYARVGVGGMWELSAPSC